MVDEANIGSIFDFAMTEAEKQDFRLVFKG